MKHRLHFVILLGALFAVIACAVPTPAKSTRMPATVTLRDSRDGFTSGTLVSTRHGRFDVCLGECHEGDPGFEGNEDGAEFEYGIVIYHLEPKRQPLPYEPIAVPLARGLKNRSVTPLFAGVKRVRFKGVTFEIRFKKLSSDYGAGKTIVQVRATD